MLGIPVLPPQQRVLVQIINSELREDRGEELRSEASQWLELEIDILTGAETGQKIFKTLNICSPDGQTQKIAERELSQICHATGRLSIVDKQQLHMVPFYADITVEPARDGSEPSNGIVNLSPYYDAPPAKDGVLLKSEAQVLINMIARSSAISCKAAARAESDPDAAELLDLAVKLEALALEMLRGRMN